MSEEEGLKFNTKLMIFFRWKQRNGRPPRPKPLFEWPSFANCQKTLRKGGAFVYTDSYYLVDFDFNNLPFSPNHLLPPVSLSLSLYI